MTSVLISHQFTVLTAAELKTPAKIAQWATNALYAYNSNPEFAKTQPLLTRGLGPGVGGALALYGLETAYPANINPTSSAANMVTTRVNHDIAWLTSLIARFGSNGVSDFLEELKRHVKWQGGAVSSEAKVLQFAAQISELVAKTSPTVLASAGQCRHQGTQRGAVHSIAEKTRLHGEAHGGAERHYSTNGSAK